MAKNIMFQGTGSTVGKSLLNAALCRVLNDEGFVVKPFKSQNMALNSFITKNGKEMGRAQVVQAEAARIEPTVEMNPILLKPTSDKGSQVVVMGEVFSNKSAVEYYELKDKLKEIVLKSYNKLSTGTDIIVLEGAGSPAEINLKDKDIVNMGMANMVDAPVILIGDIDKGGVFASLYGTLELLDEEERARIKAFIINKFRGDVELLKPGIKMIEEKMGIPCLGVMPYFRHSIDDEDSISSRLNINKDGNIVVGVVLLPYMSNFSDFTVFEVSNNVKLKYIKRPNELNDVDLIILPGSKNTIKDLDYLKENGFSTAIKKAHFEGTPVVGVCGGYQMLGREIIDPHLVESVKKRTSGLGLLDVITTMAEKKTTKQITGKISTKTTFIDNIYDSSVTGYEIHMGITELNNIDSFITLQDGRKDGAVSKDGLVIGTYLHGIFDNDSFRNNLLNYLGSKKNIDIKETSFSYAELKEKEYDKLAKTFRENVDIEAIKKIVGV